MQRSCGWAWVCVLTAFFFLAAPGVPAQQKPLILRVGYFPNITHAQALVGRASGQFDKAVGPGVQIEWKAFNAGPSAIEAMFANAIDMTYVGPNPTVTGYVRSQGEAVRVIAGAASGGASLVVRQGAGIQKRFGFPRQESRHAAAGQYAGYRAALLVAGQRPEAAGKRRRRSGSSDHQCRPATLLFLKGQLDAAWAPEPWAARLVHEGGRPDFPR